MIDTTTYEVNSKTGKVTPTTVRTYGKTKAPTVEKRVVPSPVVYEKMIRKKKVQPQLLLEVKMVKTLSQPFTLWILIQERL